VPLALDILWVITCDKSELHSISVFDEIIDKFAAAKARCLWY